MAGMTSTITYDSMPKLLNGIDDLLDGIADQTADVALEEIQHRAPVASGAMRDGYYKAETGKGSREVRSADDLEYPMYVEYGTSRMRAQPHVTPAAHQAELRSEEILRRAAESWAGGR
jgi:HK97 gp10 family phage protein